MDSWKNLIEVFNHPTVRRKYPVINVLNNELTILTPQEELLEIENLKKFFIENNLFPDNVFKKPYFNSQTGITLYFPNVISFHPNKLALYDSLQKTVSALLPDGLPEHVERVNYIDNLLKEINGIFDDNCDVTDIYSLHKLFENDKIKTLTLKVKTDLTNGVVSSTELLDDLLILIEPLLLQETKDQEVLRIVHSMLLKLKNNETFDLNCITPVICKFQKLLTFK